MFLLCQTWLYGAFLGLFFSLFSNFFYSRVSSLLSLFLIFLFFLFFVRKKEGLIIIILSGFFWTTSYNAPFVQKDNLVKIHDNYDFFKPLTFSSQQKSESSFIHTKISLFKSKIKKKLKKYPKNFPWLQSLILGERKDLSFRQHIRFSTLGLYHLLVLSGLHITIFAVFCFSSCLGPFLLAYCLNLISCGTFFFFKNFIIIFVCFLLLFYGALVDFPPSVQRASLSYILFLLLPVLGFQISLKERLTFILFLQIFIFPKNFLDNSNLLSWGSLLIILYSSLGKKANLWRILKAQISLSLLIAVSCAKISFLGLLLNLFIIPVFSFSYCLALLSLFDSFLPPFIISLALEFQNIFLSLIDYLAQIPQFHTYLYLDLLSYHHFFQWALLLLFSYFFTKLIHSFK